ncbi:MAG: fimbrillin family protein, partial [Bacteroidales bacterium]|nr:fimbrillin family protein [Bacteroidales bacterium]
MKKRLFLSLAALATLALTGCQKDVVLNEVPQETPVAFGTYLGRDAQTKASELTTETLKTAGFGVYAYYHSGDWVDNASLVPNFMNNQPVYFDNTDSRWEYSPLKYWPSPSGATNKISFFAYAPYSSSIVREADGTTGEPIITVTKDTDFTYAVAGSTMTSLKNLISTNAVDGKVHFKFKHAMSRVGLTVKVADQLGNSLDAGSIVTITGLSVSCTGVWNKAKLNLGTGTITYLDDIPENKGTASLTFDPSVDFSGNELSNTVTSLSSTTKYMMLIPQSNIPIAINVNYTITTTDAQLSSDVSFDYTNSASTNITLDKGKAY